MIGEEATSAEGVLKMNCKVLDSSQLKKLDKQEKVLAQEIHSTGKGESECPILFIGMVIRSLLLKVPPIFKQNLVKNN